MKPDLQNTALLVLALLLQDFSQEIRKLGADSPDERAAAEDALVQAGDAAVPRLAEAYPTADAFSDRACRDAAPHSRTRDDDNELSPELTSAEAGNARPLLVESGHRR